MWKSLKNLYQNNKDQRKLVLKEKLQKIKCEKGDTISTYLNKLTTCREELGSVGITTNDDDMVSLSLLVLPKSWHSYQDSVNGREKLPDWEQLWSDLMQEEIRRSTKDGSSSKHDDEDNLSLASKSRRGKGKASHSKSSSSHVGKKIEKSKVRCFNCHEVGYYVTNCPLKKYKKGSSKGSEGEALASQFELDFTLMTCMASSMVGCVWYLDSGASFHMTDDKSLFSTLEDKYLKMPIDMGDDGKFRVSGESTVVFQREHGAPLTLNNVKYVPGLKKNMVSITMLEDRGYDVVFSKGKAFLRHIAMGQYKRIRIRVRNLYRLEVDDCASLSLKLELVQSQDIGKLWHRRLGHLHHKALKIMQQISTGLPKGKLKQVDTCKGCTLAEGIKQKLTAPHNPQQNGVAERKNRMIVGVARVMLHDQGLPLLLWAKACNIVVYLQNRSLHHILQMKTPKEAFSNKRPDVGHFRIFGSSVYCHVTKDARKKLEQTAELGILVGYTNTPHNYQVYLPTSQRIFVCRDIMFDEQKAM
eukprot:PITA_07000